MPELVSVIIPVYNSAPFLDDCLESVANQTHKSLEVIIINDGSTDNSEDIINKHLASNPNFTYFTQENRGLGYTRNRGIKLSNGTSIFFLDSDDIIPEDAIHRLAQAKEKYNSDMAAGKVLRFTKERKYIPVRHHEFGLYTKNECVSLLDDPKLIQDSIACNKLWDAAFLKQNKLIFEVGKYYEDMHFTLRASVLANRIAVIKEPIYLWRVREEENKPSITQQRMKLKNTLDRIAALSLNREWLINNGTEAKITYEHDLKALLDVLRLHAEKYALVEASERKEWQSAIQSFLKKIPPGIAEALPQKEMNLYTLILNDNFQDLLLFSLMYTNTETSPIVFQSGPQFFLKGESQTYNITQDIKPVVKVNGIELQNQLWLLKGVLHIPKASEKPPGTFYAEGRKQKRKVPLIVEKTKPENLGAVYPYEKQAFHIKLSPSDFKWTSIEAGYDFYFQLENGNPVRVKADASLHSGNKSFVASSGKISFYRTEYGNLSLQFDKGFLYKFLRKIYRTFK